MTVTAKQLNIEVPELEQILSVLSELFNIRTAFLYNITEDHYLKEIAGNNGDFRPFCKVIQSEWKDRCTACDMDKFAEAATKKEPLLYRCYNGLYEMFLPLFIEEILIGYLHFGQVRSEDNFEEITLDCGLDRHPRHKELRRHYYDMEVVSKKRLQLICQLFSQLADHILKSKLIEIKQARPEYFLKKYIQENVADDISVEGAAEYINRSKSFVTHKFKETYGESFSNYVRSYRIKCAKQHLKTKTINETWPLCGFKNRYHFSRVFKKIAGLPPGEYQNIIDA